ncbi:hypothetical protein KI387_019948, partial [Taxus chinensis]
MFKYTTSPAWGPLSAQNNTKPARRPQSLSKSRLGSQAGLSCQKYTRLAGQYQLYNLYSARRP